MDLTEAIRMGEKIRPWITRNNELRAGLDALIEFARKQNGGPEVPKRNALTDLLDAMGKGTEELFGEMFGMPTEEGPEPAPEPPKATSPSPVFVVDADGATALPVGSFYVPCSSTGVPQGEPRVRRDRKTLTDWKYYRVLYRAPGVPEPKPEPEYHPGDVVPWSDLDKIPVGSVVEHVTGERGIVRLVNAGLSTHDVAWADGNTRGGGTVKIVMIRPEGK